MTNVANVIQELESWLYDDYIGKLELMELDNVISPEIASFKLYILDIVLNILNNTNITLDRILTMVLYIITSYCDELDLNKGYSILDYIITTYLSDIDKADTNTLNIVINNLNILLDRLTPVYTDLIDILAVNFSSSITVADMYYLSDSINVVLLIWPND